MPDGGNLNIWQNLVSFARFTGYDISMSLDPERWHRDFPTYIAMVFPHPNPKGYIDSLPKLPIIESVSYYGLEVNGELEAVVALLFDGLLDYRRQSWQIANPHHPRLSVPVPEYSDIYLAESKAVSTDSALACLYYRLKQEPPSIFFAPQET